MLASIVLNRLKKDGLYVIDAGMINIVYRYWTIKENKSIKYYNPSLVHLPYDKVFLSKLNIRRYENSEWFLRRHSVYRIYCFFKRIAKKKYCKEEDEMVSL
jgi:hypothetical protein